MLMVHSAMAAMTGAGLSGGKTYAEWLAHIAVRAPTAPAAESAGISTLSLPNGASLRRIQMSSSGSTGAMGGSPFYIESDRDGRFSTASALRRVIQHGLPSQAEFSAQKAAARVILVEFRRITNNGTDFDIFGQDRNGFTSADFAVPVGTVHYQVGGGAGTFSGPGVGANVGVSYWDEVVGKPMSYFPRANGDHGPFDYIADGW